MKMTSRILVTGGTGLVGAGIQAHLKKHHVEGEQWIYLSSKEGDLRSLEDTRKIFAKYQPTHVIHLAAMVGGLFRNMREKLEFYRANSAMNDNVLLCCHEFKVQKCISCMSTCIFPDKTTYPIDETMIHDGPPHPSNEGYAYAKRMLDVLNRCYHEAHGSQFTSVIPTNIFGPHDNFNMEDGHVIPGLIHKCYLAKKHNTDFVVWGSGTPLRQFIFNEDLGALLVWTLHHYNDPSPLILSVGEEDEVAIRDVANMIGQAMNFQGRIVYDTTKADGQFKKTASNKKLINMVPEFKFTPITEAIAQSVRWFEENFDAARK